MQMLDLAYLLFAYSTVKRISLALLTETDASSLVVVGAFWVGVQLRGGTCRFHMKNNKEIWSLVSVGNQPKPLVSLPDVVLDLLDIVAGA